jgi:hypothetical protein
VNQEEKDREKLRKRFPTKKARIVADKAVDALASTESMSRFTDVWIAAYRAAGGYEKQYED